MLKSSRVALPRSLALGVSALGVLLAVLGTLQYRWLGQISEADQAVPPPRCTPSKRDVVKGSSIPGYGEPGQIDGKPLGGGGLVGTLDVVHAYRLATRTPTRDSTTWPGLG